MAGEFSPKYHSTSISVLQNFWNEPYVVMREHGLLQKRRPREPELYQAARLFELLPQKPNDLWQMDVSVPQKRRERWEFGLPQSACRSRLQTTVSGFGQEPWS